MMTLSIVSAKFNGETQKEKNYIAIIHCLATPTISGILAVVTIDENNNCKVMIENCAPLMSPLRGTISWDWWRLKKMNLYHLLTPQYLPSAQLSWRNCQKFRKPQSQEKKLPANAISRYRMNSEKDTSIILFNHQEAIRIDKYHHRLAKNFKHKIHLKNEDPVY
jgi:hypothetical protein